MTSVEVRGGYKFFGSASDPHKKIVLNHLDMTVETGTIYGLLGASGCGKTTLLSCIVGVRKLNGGKINVLGRPPGVPGSGVPGPRIGYMPQEVALVDEFTIKETLYYFGRIYGMTEDRIYERFKLLHELLELPDANRFIVNCSGGQQRRVSFAAAMVHEPELLILDEPTVGLDPILREKIWHFLVESTRNSKLAVIITTHYIEEANQANKIGLMRNGILLAEDAPKNILTQFECSSLEDAFLILSQKQGKSEEADSTLRRVETATNRPVDVVTDEKAIENIPKKSPLKRNLSFQETKRPGLVGKFQLTSKSRMKALMTKNILQLIRQPSGIIFCFLFPILQLSCFYLAIGGNPRDLKLGIVNYEVDDFRLCQNESLITTFAHDYTCDLYKISCRFLHELTPDIAKKVYFDTKDEAHDAAKKGKITGYIHFARNFTESITEIRDEGRHADNSTFYTGEISIYMDMTDQQISYFLERKLRSTYQKFSESLMTDCELPVALGNIPIHFYEPIFGYAEGEFKEFIAPGIIMTMVFFLATLVTSTIFITDKLDGVWDRTLIAGISVTELLVAHVITQSVIMVIQCLEVVFYAAYFFNAENRGDNVTVIGLLTLLGFAGMLFGLLISIFCESHTTASFVATGSFYPMIILCGLLWPLEGMPTILRYIAYTFPFTIPSLAVRNILSKGWSITHAQVANGFGVVILWIVVLFILCIMGLKMKR
ncbi:ABC transporter G family member 23 [Lutzomyia longipalpis]|uniref:ABC transporter G family member 23 n=1 Tax=Lutzomyia longipalpis TaxID=7200 RepID=UPI002484401F|nr:ABC transporter G family member 23 [Lutzomyia longipalpis]XP_055688092.1 ABC transporter G family member 23 [Lutzomyia longipalpis]